MLLALGGWNDSAGDKYSRLVNSPAARKKFVAHAVQFLEKFGFDGLDLDWEYPVCWQVSIVTSESTDIRTVVSDRNVSRGRNLQTDPTKRVIVAGRLQERPSLR